jgi:hypothetical protein
MRTCRYRNCGQPFWPAKAHYYFCSWACHQAHYADTGNDYRGYERSRNESYDRGFWDGARARPPEVEIPPGIWRGLLLFCHPDKWEGEPGLLTLASDVTRWLLEHQPQGPES